MTRRLLLKNGVAGEALRQMSVAEAEVVKYEPEHLQGYWEAVKREADGWLRKAEEN